jgi:hypothetical protein
MLVIVGVSRSNFLIQAKWTNLLLLVVPHDHLPIQDASLSIHVILDVLRYLRAIDPRVVVGVPPEEFDDAVFHVALDALPVKLGLHEDALGVTADQVCYLVGREFACGHRLDWEKTYGRAELHLLGSGPLGSAVLQKLNEDRLWHLIIPGHLGGRRARWAHNLGLP